jgi:serine/threonine protein kinase
MLTAADLVNFLRQSSILERDQLEEAARDLQVRFPEARALARELLQRGWLTPYQVNQLLADSGRNLVLRPYVVLERLGAGGTGQVFKARHQHMQRVVALKVIRPELLADADVVNRFHREIQIASQVSHPNVVHAYDAGDIGGAQTLVLEYVEGTSLDRMVMESGPLPVRVACDYMRQAALGLQHIHECGLIHRDIKPSNLLVTGSRAPTNGKGMKPATGLSTGQSLSAVKILDLGLARLQRGRESRESTTITSGGAVTMGTPDYMAPEQALDLRAADIRADIYSLGCTLYFLLTGKPPFGGGTLAQKLMRHQQAEPPSLAKQRGGLPKGLERVVRKMLAKKPEDRYQTPAAVASALEQFCNSGTVRLPGATTTVVGPRRRRWLVPLGAAAALLVLATPVVWWASAPARQDSRAIEQAALLPTPTAVGTQRPPPPQPPTSTPASRPGPAAVPTASRPASSGTLVRGRGVVRDALIDFAKPDRKLGAEPKSNDLRRSDQCNAFLVRFDLSRAVFAPDKLDKATVSFFVWDPHEKGITKVCAFGVLTPWDEATVTWKQAAEGKPWKGGKNFVFGVDTGPASPHVAVKPDPVNDTVDPPIEYQLDITPLARSWLADKSANHGLVIAPVSDRAVDDGWHSRFQIYASEHNRVQYTPTLTLHMR